MKTKSLEWHRVQHRMKLETSRTAQNKEKIEQQRQQALINAAN